MEVTATKGQIIKGKPVADQISENLIKEVDELVKEGINPKLAIVRVGARGDDLAYERGALKRCQTIGIETEVVELAEDITQEDYEKTLRSLNENKDVHGILCLRPFPNQLNEEAIKYVISPEKDVDCFSPINSAKIMEGDKSGFPPCTPTAVVEILKHYDVELNGANVAVLGRSMVVGKPAAMLLNYPVITSGEYAHRGSFKQLLGGNETEELLELLSLEKQVTEHTPPAFIWHTYTDQSVPVQNSLLLIEAMKKYEIPVEFHMYPVGKHGLSTCSRLTAMRDE